MIKIPDPKKMYDYETNYHLTLDVSRLGKLIAHYEIYKKVMNVPGSIVECGVFRGGSAMMIAYSMMKFNLNENKNLWLYDTFDGMSDPSEYDINILNQKAHEEMSKNKKKENTKDIWAYSKLEHVKKN